MLLEIKNLTCGYGKEIAVEDVNFSVRKGERFCLIGPSGCGKSTILRAIAGFHKPKSGEIIINKELVSDVKNIVPTQKRRVGMVFQDHALFPHLSVRDNVTSGLWAFSKNEKARIATKYMEIMGIRLLANRFPHQLSGGQQQRVALARALAPRPLLLLMDEPFSNLDLDLRLKMGEEISELLKANDITCVMVTHDQQDAFIMGDKLGVMSHGRLLQWDSPHNIYHKPANRFVAEFIGDGVLVDGMVNGTNNIETELINLNIKENNNLIAGTKVHVLIRPEDVLLDRSGNIKAKILKRTYKGPEILYTLMVNHSIRLMASFSSHSYFSVGDEVGVKLKLDHVIVFKK